jgi:DNA-binding transcriptional regulator YdaS (Cro superfamily)
MEALNKAIEAVDGVGRLALEIGVTQSAVSNWRARGGYVPSEHCAAIEMATKGTVTRRDLRPDDWFRIWPELVTAEHPAPEVMAAPKALQAAA